ncbi:MAG TPA: SGNH/GDSL hydrolase family protein [bacterium]|nr:SGNH/GDSL hydrolase family protein [bacterium]
MVPDYFSGIKNSLIRRKRFIFALLHLLIILGLAEFLLRTFDVSRLMDADFRFYIRRVDNDLEKDFNREDSLLMWSLRPGYDDGEGYIKINSRGFRDREYKFKKDKRVFRILCLGDSTTWGYRLLLSETYHSLLEDRLNREYGGKLRFEVINFGVTGYSTFQSLMQLQYRGLKYKPDIVTYYGLSNDPTRRFSYSDSQIMSGKVPVFIRMFLNGFLLKLSTYRILRKIFLYALRRNPQTRKSLTPRVSPEEFKKNILLINSLCRNRDIPFALFSQPFCRRKSVAFARFADVTRYKRDLEEIAAENRIPVITIPEMESDSLEASAYFDDSSHPNAPGHAVIMERMFRFLSEKGLLPQK